MTADKPETAPTYNWVSQEGWEYLFAERMSFRVYRHRGNGTNDPAYAVLQLLTSSGWTNLERWGLGDTYYGLTATFGSAICRLKKVAEFLVTNNAQISEPSPKS